MAQQMGRQSLQFENPPWIISSGCIAGTKEGEGPIGHEIDLIGEDDNFGCDIWEEAESTLQKEALTLALGKAGLRADELRYLFAGDLLGQSMATSFGLQPFEIPLFGLYGACSTAGEALALAAMTVAAGYADVVGAVTSSHFASAEKQFRFPLEYANQRPLCTTWTVTGAGAFLLGRESGKKQNYSDNRKRTDAGSPMIKRAEQKTQMIQNKRLWCSHHRHHYWENRRLRCAGFHEYGSRYGSGGSGLYSGASERFFQKSILV